MSGTTSISPPEQGLKAAVISLKREHPALGIAKLHALLLLENPGWTVSEKRLRRILKDSKGVAQPQQHQAPEASSSETHLYPSSTLVEGLDVTKWSPAVEVKYYDRNKGKGLVAKEPISEGQVIWKEDPFIVAPEWEIYDLQLASRACAHCTTPLMDRLSSSPSLVLRCTTASSACPARFCNRLCLRRSEQTHPLLCPAQNPASVPLLGFARRNAWMALHALAQCTARMLLAHQQQGRRRVGRDDGDRDGMEEDWRLYSALADLGMEERAQGSWMHGAEPDRATWQTAHSAFVEAFVLPPEAAWQKKLAKLLKRPTPKEVADALFTYDGFLHGLGRMSLNLEAHGGLYTLHSHLNHSCSPNISVRHLDQRTALSRITIIAKRDIGVGQELLITYVDPSLGVRERRSQLYGWGFGQCKCERCVEEEKGASNNQEGQDQDLESELKAGLGIV
ncbi:SET domain-containing protein [Russula earlei]|uniref:SET domain-containing protein n=1 Tax=Russula earlei TaxID=71964 RepID=A0ACC0U8H7_9AGAM|nr:SET domain-containing protein [Russula earlei]